MTVKELIEKLQQFDENTEVIVDTDGFWHQLDDIHSVELQHFKDCDDKEITEDRVVIS